MKRILALLTIFLTFNLFGQTLNIPNKLQLEERVMMLNNAERNGYVIILDGKEKTILKQFSAYLQEKNKWSLKTKSGILIGEDLFNSNFSEKHFMLQAMVKKTGEGNELRCFISFGTDIYVSSTEYASESANTFAMLKNYAKYYYTNYVNDEVASKNKEIAKANKSLASVKKEFAGREKAANKAALKIEKLKKKRVKTEEKIRKLQENMELGDTEIKATEAEIVTIEEKKIELKKTEEEAQKVVVDEEKALKILRDKLTKINAF